MIFEEDITVDNTVNIKTNRFKIVLNFFKDMFNMKTIQYLILLILTFNVEFLGVKPFPVIMLGVATIMKVPLLIPFVVSTILHLITGFDALTFVNYIITYVLYTVFASIIEIEGYSKKYITLTKLAVATLISNIITLVIFKDFNFVDLVVHLMLVIAMYPVFTLGIGMITNLNKKIIFSKEEIISSAVILTCALVPFAKFSIYGFSVVNVILTAVIVVIGWKNDWSVGTLTGVTIGLVYSIITKQNSLIVTSFAFSGLIAGLLSRFNKFVVVLAFILGNFGLSALYLKDATMFIRLAEVMIASGIILALPKKVMLKLDSIFSTTNALGKGYENLLAAADTRDRLNAMSEVLDNLAHITTAVTDETLEETSNVIKKYLLDYKTNECISCVNRASCLADEIDKVSNHLAERLENGKKITKEMLPIDCELKDELISNIESIYSNIKLMRIVKQKEDESNKKLAEEYKTISSLIKNLAKEENSVIKTDTKEQKQIREELKYMGYVVYEDNFVKEENNIVYEFITDILIDINKAKKEIQKIVSDIVGVKMSIKLVLNSSKTEKSRIKLVPSSKYVVKAVVKQVRKADSSVSGDSYIVTELKDNSKVIAISDGMGSGEKSHEVSSTVISMIEKMNATGLNKKQIIDIVNKLIKLKENGEVSATLDMCAINEKTNNLEFVKLGAAPSYIIRNNEVIEIKQNTMPMGIIDSLEYSTVENEINKGDYVVLISDGAMTDINKHTLQQIVEKMEFETSNEKTVMDSLMKVVVGSQNKIILDDVTVVVCKIA